MPEQIKMDGELKGIQIYTGQYLFANHLKIVFKHDLCKSFQKKNSPNQLEFFLLKHPK